MSNSLIDILTGIVNNTTVQTVELQKNYSEYVYVLLKNLNSPLEIDIEYVSFDGENYITNKIKKIFLNENDDEIICTSVDGNEIKWYELSLLSMDIIINKIHIELLTQLNMKQNKQQQ